MITLTEPGQCPRCKKNITYSSLCSFCAESRIKELEEEIKELKICHNETSKHVIEAAMAQLRKQKTRIEELEARLEPCDTCGSIDCEDASMEYYIKRWKEAENRVAELEELVEKLSCQLGGALRSRRRED